MLRLSQSSVREPMLLNEITWAAFRFTILASLSASYAKIRITCRKRPAKIQKETEAGSHLQEQKQRGNSMQLYEHHRDHAIQWCKYISGRQQSFLRGLILRISPLFTYREGADPSFFVAFRPGCEQ